MRREIVGLCLGLSLASGCFGSFRLVNTVYDFNRDISDSIIVQEVVFLAFVVVQVYSVATLADVVVFNVLEAITGDNPISAGPPESRVVSLPDGRTVAVIEDGDGVLIAVEGQRLRRLLRRGTVVTLMEDGVTVAHVARLEHSEQDGAGLQITDASGQVHAVSAAELERSLAALAP